MSEPISVTPLPRPVRTHSAPRLSHLVTSSYAPPKESQPPTSSSSSGPSSGSTIESNLLILFHGLGDSHLPFFQLGQSFSLPQTCILSIRAPSRVPLLEEEAWQWWPSFDELGEIIPRPNPTSTLELLTKVLVHLTKDLQWLPSQIHFFGNSQGASAAGELALLHFRQTQTSLASIVSISGPLLSFPTLTHKCRTKALVVMRKGEESSVGLSSWRKGFEHVKSVVLGPEQGRGPMPRGEKEWYEVMRFWSEVLVRRSPIEFEEGVYAVDGGVETAQRAGVAPPPSWKQNSP